MSPSEQMPKMRWSTTSEPNRSRKNFSAIAIPTAFPNP